MRTTGLSMLVAGSLLLGAMTSTAAASAASGDAQGGGPGAQPSCGDTITTDTTLEADLVDCPNNGIIIGADDVTLDLNGHVIEVTAPSSPAARRTNPVTSASSISNTEV